MYAYILFNVVDHSYDKEILCFPEIAASLLPSGFDPVPDVIKHGDFVLFHWHVKNDPHGVREKINPGPVASVDGSLFFASGYAAEGMINDQASPAIFDLIEQTGSGIRMKDSAGGVSANVWLAPSGNSAHCWSTQPPAIPTFYAKARPGYCVVGNRPRLVHAASILSTMHQIDRAYLPKYLSSGCAFDGRTPYEGTAAVPPNRSLLLGGGNFELAPYPLHQHEEIPYDTPLEEKSKRLAELLKGAIWPTKATGNANLFLSGGKDSRALSCALRATNTDVNAFTIGSSSIGDAVTARHVADAAGWKYETRLQPVVSDILKAAANSNRSTDGLGIAFAHQYNFTQELGFLEWLPSLHGHGHLLRGGFGRIMRQSKEQLRAVIDRAFMSPYATEAANSSTRLGISAWLEDREPYFRDARDILLYGQMDYRLGIFTAPSSLDLTWRTFMVYPLLDERVCRFATGMTVFDRISERVVFGAMQILAKELTELPLFGEQWRFDKSPEMTEFADSNHNFQDGFEKRQPLGSEKMIDISLSESSFAYDADRGHVSQVPSVKSQFILGSSVRSEIEKLVTHEVMTEIHSVASSGKNTESFARMDKNTRFTLGAFVNRVFIASSLYDLRW